jgi:hypothetical protein
MKLLFFSSILALVSGSIASDVVTRELVSDNFLVDFIGVTADTSTGVFTLTAQHNEGEAALGDATWAGLISVYIFRTCPGGQAENVIANPGTSYMMDNVAQEGTYVGSTTDADVISWMNPSAITTTKLSGDNYESTFTFQVDSDVQTETDAAGVLIWTDDGATAPASGGDADFCIWFGIGPTGEDPLGFQEVTVKASFTYDGGFVFTGYQTTAFDIEAGAKVFKDYRAQAAVCNPTIPIYPGEPVCLKVYPEMRVKVGPGGTFTTWALCAATDCQITSVTSMDIKGPKNANSGVTIDSLTADLTGGTQKCGLGSAATDTHGNAVAATDCHVLSNLPIYFFNTYENAKSTYDIDGVSVIESIDPVRRMLSHRRRLADVVQKPISNEIELEIIPSEDSSASAMAVGAVGLLASAALLI